MRFRFREIKENKEEKERISKEEWQNGAGNIKPESDITVEECRNFWDDLFNSVAEENN